MLKEPHETPWQGLCKLLLHVFCKLKMSVTDINRGQKAAVNASNSQFCWLFHRGRYTFPVCDLIKKMWKYSFVISIIHNNGTGRKECCCKVCFFFSEVKVDLCCSLSLPSWRASNREPPSKLLASMAVWIDLIQKRMKKHFKIDQQWRIHQAEPFYRDTKFLICDLEATAGKCRQPRDSEWHFRERLWKARAFFAHLCKLPYANLQSVKVTSVLHFHCKS